MKEKGRSRLFKKAFIYLKSRGLVKTQKDLAGKIGIGTTPVSHLMNGSSLPSYETLLKMNDVFGGIFNLEYFTGDSDVMLAGGVGGESLQPGSTDDTLREEMLAMLREKVSDKEETIASLKRELAAKDELIENMKQQVSDLRSVLSLKSAESGPASGKRKKDSSRACV